MKLEDILDELFRVQLESLREGYATFSKSDADPALQSPDDAAAGLVQVIALHLRHGGLTPTMANLLADYLDTLDSPDRWSLLGLKETHRRKSKQGQKHSAALAFAEAHKAGRDERDALIAAYDAYFAAGAPLRGRPFDTYASDAGKPGNRHLNKAEQRLASTVRPALVEFGLLPRNAPGRPKKQK